jgi:DNA polymerase III epsilon subunit-like protein
MANNKSRILSIDVECVAINFTHDGRSPCSVAIVDDQCNTIFSSLIKPTEKVVSDLYPITGLRIKDLEHAPTFEEVLQKVKEHFFSLKEKQINYF